MARPKEFDPHAALKVAMQTFRRRGYEGTSVQDLVDALGINRSSMYAAFGSKHDLYLKALERYSADEKAKAENDLAGDGPALPALRAFLLSYVDAALTDPERNGCLVTHGVMERVPCDPEATARLRAALRGMEDAYTALLLRARANGELAPGTDVKSVARFLVTFTQGLRVMEKAADREYLIEAVDQALSVFRAESADAADAGAGRATPD
ncbi:TetR/AcrR family transcriptional regulator [Streptomyces yunnanensis]|uniref:TetR/AcrR family transcriptional regulator n=1 Tax=Streptomyces yunnanensis TaxID=156453 RepID=A0ABY8A5C0_9ACTN|nr:TetR/AcrR family transcriptional regulator [Streptomyces yunnanensis]WEB39931.1 TetR/AcrR family transcriptional regulator [Streptomyces yunnanensis]